MIDFFSPQNSSQHIVLQVIYAIILSVVLSTALAFTYSFTNKNVQRNRNFMQAMILISIVAAMVIQAIGDSVAVGLGMMGALSIIRFRNTVNNPRNIVFIFASLAIGIACGVYGFYIATIGTVGFIVTALVIHYSTLSRKSNMIGSVVLVSTNAEIQDYKTILDEHCKRYTNTRLNIRKNEENQTSYEHHFQFRLKEKYTGLGLNQALTDIPSASIARFNVRDTAESI